MADYIPTTPSESERTKISTFINKFTAAERTAIWDHIQNDANALTIHMKSSSLRGGLLETDPAVITGMNLAVSAALVTDLRKDEILNVEI